MNLKTINHSQNLYECIDTNQQPQNQTILTVIPKMQRSLAPIEPDTTPQQICDAIYNPLVLNKQSEANNLNDMSQSADSQKLPGNINIEQENQNQKIQNHSNDTQINYDQKCMFKQQGETSFLGYQISDASENSHETQKKFFPKTFKEGHRFFSQLFFIHVFKFMWKVKTKIINKGLKLRIKHLPILEDDEKIESLFENVSKTYKNILQNTKTFTKKDMIKLVFFGQLKGKFFLILLCYLIDSLGRSFVSILMTHLYYSVFDQNLKGAYIYGSIISIINMVTLIARNNGSYMASQFQIKVRMILINLVYQKMTELNSFSIKQANLGKIINTISSDLNLLELYIPNVFLLIVLPIQLAFGSGVLYVRFNGPIGLLGILFMVIVYPLQFLYQRMTLIQTIESRQFGDKRLRLLNEMIEGIRLIKIYAWEQPFVQMIKDVRKMEFARIIKISIIAAFDKALNTIVHIWASFLFFVVLYYGDYANVTSINMVATIYLMIQMKTSCILFVSLALNGFINVRINIERIVDLLTLKNIEMKQFEYPGQVISHEKQLDTGQFLDRKFLVNPLKIHSQCINQIPIISFRNFSCFWMTNISEFAQPVLKNIYLDIYPGELVAIIGRNGSGKSSLFSSILMEVPSYQGRYFIKEQPAVNQLNEIQVGYVQQDPFIFPGSFKNNILFGRPFNCHLYNLVIHVSCLNEDLRLMQNGDETQLSEKGFNLSKGQRARVSLARALYQLADIYLFDAILSLVDNQVARSILDNAIKDFIFKVQPKLTGSSTLPVVMIATHLVQFAVECDYVIVLDSGSIIAKGHYDDIKNSLNMVTKDFIIIDSDKNYCDNEISRLSNQTDFIDREKIEIKKRQDNSKMIVNLKSFQRYFGRWTPKYRIIFIIIQCLGQEVIFNFYVRYIALFEYTNKTGQEGNVTFRILGILLAVAYLNNLTKHIFTTNGVLETNRNMHTNMIDQLSICPIEYFDNNPAGRTLNRFSTDLQLTVSQMSNVILDVLELSSFFFVSLIVLIILQIWIIFVIIFTAVLNVVLYIFSYQIIAQARECDLKQRSPLFDIFKKTVAGIIEIKLYKQQNWFQTNYFELTNKCIQSNLTYYYTQKSFSINLDIVAWISSTIGIFIIIGLDASDKPIFIQALLLFLIFNENHELCLKQMIQSYTIMNSFNRMFQIIDLNPEAPHHSKIDDELKELQISNNTSSWPSQGKIEFNNVFMRYRKDTDTILNNMTFKINPGEKIGCVGRTGAGKSSIVQALLRIVEIEQRYVYSGSSILIDDQDISKLGLNFLRSSIGVIPQIPFVFSGTIRRNLDPFEKFTDDILWQALDETNLSAVVQKFDNQLGTDMTDSNSIFSIGENQLISLARIILNPKKIIILDEATANVDIKADEFIQRKIREKFPGCTIFAIAHRLITIANCDKVMVIEQGKVVEFAHPLELLSKNRSNPTIDTETLFAKLVKKNGPKYAALILKIAKTHYQENMN